MAIQALEKYQYTEEAFLLTTRTLDGIAAAYSDWKAIPETLWEVYAPMYPAPASHKRDTEKLGAVRKDFGGWTCCLINLIVENAMGINVNAPDNTVCWDIRLYEKHGIKQLCFGKVVTDLIAVPESGPRAYTLNIKSKLPYKLIVTCEGQKSELMIKEGMNRIQLQKKGKQPVK